MENQTKRPLKPISISRDFLNTTVMVSKHVTFVDKMTVVVITNGRYTEFQLMRWFVDGSSTNFQSLPKNAGTLDVASPTVCISLRKQQF